jgi:Tfp pilus assembly protein PilO
MDLSSLKKSKIVNYLAIFKKEKPKKYSLLGLTLFTCIFFLLFAINPTLSTIANLRKQLDDLNLIDESLQTKIANMDKLQARYQVIEPDLGLITEAIPQEADSVKLTGQVQQVAISSNVNLIGMSVSDISFSADTTSTTASFRITIVVEGSYSNVSNFLDKLFTMQRIITFESISIDKSLQTGALISSIKGVAYFKK